MVPNYPREEIWKRTEKRNVGVGRFSCKRNKFCFLYEAGARSLCCKHSNKGQHLVSKRSKKAGDWILVQEDEDIGVFAERFRVSPEALRVANGLDASQTELKQGDIVFVPYVSIHEKVELSRPLRLSLTKAQRADPDRKYTIVPEAGHVNMSRGRVNLFPVISLIVIVGSFVYFFSEYGTGNVAMLANLLKERTMKALAKLQQYVPFNKGDEALDSQATEWTPCTLRQKRELVPGITRYTFDLPSARRTFGLELGQRMEFEVTRYNGEHVARASYLLCTERMQQGNFDVVIPSTAETAMAGYDLSGNKDPQFASALNALKTGDSIKIRPGAKMLYYRGPKSPVDTLSVVCGGIGVAPICSLLLDILSDVESAVTSVFLLVVNERPDEFIFLDELESLEKRFSGILRLTCVWKKSEDENMRESRGKYDFIERAVASHCPVWKEGTMALLCGSDKLLIPYALKAFRRLGYSEEVTVCL